MRRRRTDRAVRLALTAAVTLAAITLATTGAGVAGASFTSAPTPPVLTLSSATLAAPSSLLCANVVGSSVTLAWTAPTGVTTPSLLRYTVSRRVSGVGSYVDLNATPQAGTTYQDVPGVFGKFDYVVRTSYWSWTSANTLPDTVTFALLLSFCSA